MDSVAVDVDTFDTPAKETSNLGAEPTRLRMRFKPTLRNFSLCVRAGELVAIVGPVGAGKSSILSVLLGELQPMEIENSSSSASSIGVHIHGKVSYCQQIPWIVSGTVKENVLFGHPEDSERYASCISACALGSDLREMPAGDETEIGERGISLSGGQKARLALARAVYSGASIHLLDDPLSAVDPRVGRILFQRCIGPGGLMDGATRVLVMHQRQYLSQCDRIIVLRDGEIAEEGTYATLAAANVPEVVGKGELLVCGYYNHGRCPSACSYPAGDARTQQAGLPNKLFYHEQWMTNSIYLISFCRIRDG